ncbi:MAG: Single-stranded-DNA-specific exonuclease recJ [Microgenomates group bacterium GW2011_GWF2_45_18]|nr:MAG: Single-stranded-DNA-specific exonuclease recJ [Microgenomates group bacterium GW2011_GWF1_44_10]KKU02100.1 MAG: Single-stranded-DNA-specific exonuclease recJ [Microgenomates group bacterium GW2011_GWF2_45_18]
MSIVLRQQSAPTSQEKLLRILFSLRGLETTQQQQEFLHPTHPSTITVDAVAIDHLQMQRATSIIHDAIQNKKNILVFGDYDADGICATTVLWKTLYSLGAKVKPFIPSREKHGYGVSDLAIDDILSTQKPDLIITVDNGIVAYKPFERLRSLGIQTIITDHHQVDVDGFPVADAVVHTTKLCGTTVAWMLARELSAQYAVELLDLCGIATIADQVPLLEANRSFALHGLQAVKHTSRPSLLALFEIAQIKQQEITAQTVNYGIVPRINAMGRIADAMDALRFMVSEKLSVAQKYASVLNKTNTDRQDLVSQALEDAISSVEETSLSSIIVVASEEYHEGVIGLIAGKLSEKYHRPALALSIGQRSIKGSGRSIRGIHLTDFLRKVREDLIDIGGHPMACGFSLTHQKLEDFRSHVFQLAEKTIDPALLVDSVEVDCVLPHELIVTETAQMLEKFEPYGQENFPPVFLVKDLTIISMTRVGREKQHLKLIVRLHTGSTIQAMWFGCDLETEDRLREKAGIDSIVSLQLNRWNGSESVQLRMKRAD